MRLLELFIQYFPSFMQALLYTLQLTAISLLIASVIGIVFGLFSVSGNRILKTITKIYVDIIRGTPLLVQAFFMYFGVTQALDIRITAFMAGTITLSLNAGAYMSEIVRGGIESIDTGQMEAARSLGLPYGKAMLRVILPQALRTMMPSIINQFIISLKDTSILSVIGIRELTMNGKIIIANNMEAIRMWTIVAFYYLVVCTVLSRIAKALERRMSYGK
ncbi:MAG: amino acid ABC transporter permease [Lachnospiraceae bacterium]